MQAWQEFAPHAPDGLFSLCSPQRAAGGPRVRSSAQFFGTRQHAARAAPPLIGTGTPTRVHASATHSYLDAQLMLGRLLGRRSRSATSCRRRDASAARTFEAKSDYVNAPLSPPAIGTMLARIERASAPARTGRVVLLDSYGGAINRVAARRDGVRPPQRALLDAVPRVLGPGGRGGRACAWLRGFYAAMRPYVSRFAYQNYIDPDLGKWGRAYYGTNLDRLITVKRRYDPQNVFRSSQGIPVRKS